MNRSSQIWSTETKRCEERVFDSAGKSVGRVVIVTGASSGIGRALASRLALSGHRVGLIARRGDLIAEAASEINASGGVAAAAVADVSDRPALRLAIATLEQELGPAGVLVANAGFGAPPASIR